MTARPLILALALALAPASALAQDSARAASDHADVLVLKDGRKLVGEVVAEGDGVVSFRAEGVTRAYARDQVQSLEKGAAPATDQVGSRTPDAEPTDKAAKKQAKAARKAGGGVLSQSARSWLGTLIERSADADPQVQRSLAAAMHALGPAAVPPLREAAAGADGGTRLFLNRVARAIEENAKRKRRGADAPMDSDRPRNDRAKGADGARRMREALVAELSITPDQRPAFDDALTAAQAQQMEIGKALRQGMLERDVARQQLTDVRTGLLASMKGILDPAQYALYEEMSANYFEKYAQKLRDKKPGKNTQ